LSSFGLYLFELEMSSAAGGKGSKPVGIATSRVGVGQYFCGKWAVSCVLSFVFPVLGFSLVGCQCELRLCVET